MTFRLSKTTSLNKEIIEKSKEPPQTKTRVNKWLIHLSNKEETENTKDIQNLN